MCEVGGRITIYTSHPKVVEEGEGEPFWFQIMQGAWLPAGGVAIDIELR